jgi:hypothetical protein
MQPGFQCSKQAENILFFFIVNVGRREALNAPSELCPTRFCLSLCTPFPALHSSARNHAARFSMFKTSGEHSVFLHCQCSVHLFCITDTGIEPITSPAEKAVATTGRHLSTKVYLRRKSLIFLFIAAQSQKGQKFKTLRQNNAVLRRAALSGPKPAADRAR